MLLRQNYENGSPLYRNEGTAESEVSLAGTMLAASFLTLFIKNKQINILEYKIM
jgi:hypothetical protein